MSPRRAAERPPTVAIRVIHEDRPGALPAILGVLAVAGGTVRTMSTVRRLQAEGGVPAVETEIEIEGLADDAVDATVADAPGVRERRPTRALDRIFGKRVIVIGGGAQVAQVALGAVSEADRHNLRGERISVDTIPLVGEKPLAEAVRAVTRLPRARALVLAGSLMGGEIEAAVRDVRAQGLLVISLNMAGSVPDAADLVVTDPIQAGVMAVMAVADTAKFTVDRLKRRVF
jgi:energy-converting hydrogenase B subunit Q